MKKHHDQWKRSVMKSVSYRVILVVLTFLISYAATQSVSQSFQITTANAIIATAVYYLHERFWSRIAWGRAK